MTDKKSTTKTILIGALIGAVAGAASGFLLVKRAEAEHRDPKLTPGEGMQIGLNVLGLLRLISGNDK